MMNAGKYKKKILIYANNKAEDADGFRKDKITEIASLYAEVKTTQGFTLIANNSDFEKALTRFTIRYSEKVMKAYEKNDRKLFVKYNSRSYSVEYLNNINEACVEIELQCKAVTK